MRAAGTEDRSHPGLIPGILLAAGTASRFGGPKLLEEWRGETLLRRAAGTLSEAGINPLIAVLPGDEKFRGQLAGLAGILLVNPAPERGIGSSIALGIGALPAGAEAVLIAVADQPLLSVDAVRSLVSSFRPGAIVAPRYGQHPGNPRIFDRRFFPELASLTGDRGGQLVADAHPEAVLEVALPEALGRDVDLPSDWAQLEDGPGSEP